MQQTNNYSLNLIEMSDTFSPEPLNDNARRLEAALDAARAEAAAGDAAEAAARTNADAAEAQTRANADAAEAQARTNADAVLDQRVTALEAKKIAVGSYAGQGLPVGRFLTVNLGFTPYAVLVSTTNHTQIAIYLAVTDSPVPPTIPNAATLKVVDGGFAVYASSVLEKANTCYNYIAFG